MTQIALDAPSRVRVVFREGSLSFNLPPRATFAELARRIGALVRRFQSAPLYVDVLPRASEHGRPAGRT